MPKMNTLVSTVTPKAYESLEKFIEIKRTDTTAFQALTLPKYAIIVGMYVLGQAASNAGTTATISIGTTSSANEIMTGYSVLSATLGVGYNPVSNTLVGSYAGHKLAADTPVFAKYTETGTASTSGGPWIVKIEYVIPGPGEAFDL